MYQIVDEVPAYIISRYPTYQAFQQALYTGEVIRDQYGRFHLREEFQPQPYYGYPMIYNARPVQNDTVIDEATLENLEFDFFNIKGIRGCFKMIENNGQMSYISLVNAEDIARGVGLITEKVYNDRQRTVQVGAESCTQIYSNTAIRWSIFNDYAQQSMPGIMQRYDANLIIPFIPAKIGKGSYIPTQLAVRIIGRCTSRKAREFQEIIYDRVVSDIENMVIEKYNLMIENMKNQNEELQRRLDYNRNLTNTDHLYRTTEIAKDFGMSAQLLNQVLYNLGLIYPVNGTWQVYQNWAGYDLLQNKVVNDEGLKTVEGFWTAFGKEVIHQTLLMNGIEIGKNNDVAIQEILNRNPKCLEYC